MNLTIFSKGASSEFCVHYLWASHRGRTRSSRSSCATSLWPRWIICSTPSMPWLHPALCRQ
eukprot:6464809-Amphidinium_carterae.1